jgi:hypothetical protein
VFPAKRKPETFFYENISWYKHFCFVPFQLEMDEGSNVNENGFSDFKDSVSSSLIEELEKANEVVFSSFNCKSSVKLKNVRIRLLKWKLIH